MDPGLLSLLININPGMIERGLIQTTTDVPGAMITREIPKVLGSLWQELGQRPNIHFLLYLNMTDGEEAENWGHYSLDSWPRSSTRHHASAGNRQKLTPLPSLA